MSNEGHVEITESIYFNKQINSTMRIASLITAALGYICAVIVFVLYGLDVIDLVIPGYWAISGGVMFTIVYFAARYGKLKGRSIYYVFLPLMFQPAILFVSAEIVLDSGAATYITGPATYIYFFLIVLMGFSFNPKLPVIAGFLAGGQYMFFYMISRDHLLELSHPDPLLLQDIVMPPVYFFKAFLMIFCGLLVGAFTSYTRRMVENVLNEEKEKEHIGKLFGQFVSEEIKNKIINEKLDLLGEKKELAVLFSDIRGFTSRSESSKPEQIVEQLNEYFEKMVACITSHGGVVDKFIGDAIMATFGGIMDLENPGHSASQAALAMQAELDQLNHSWQEKGWPTFDIGIGIHFGEVVQGTLGSQDRKEFTVIGDTVNIASRLEGVTKKVGYKVVISNMVFQNYPDSAEVQLPERIGRVKLKGRNEPIEVYGLSARKA